VVVNVKTNNQIGVSKCEKKKKSKTKIEIAILSYLKFKAVLRNSIEPRQWLLCDIQSKRLPCNIFYRNCWYGMKLNRYCTIFNYMFADVCDVSDEQIINPTHKRTEGRAPVWGSDFTTKAAHYRGVRQHRCWAKRRNFVLLVAVRGGATLPSGAAFGVSY
jgi:hypothetical protein